MGCSSFVFGLDSIVNLFTKGDITRDDLQQRFLAQHSFATLLQHCFKWLQHCCNIVSNGCNIVATLQRRVVLKIVTANRLM